MLAILSPAKALDFTSEVPALGHSQPRLLRQAAELAAVMKTKSVADLAALSSISDELAALNAGRWADFALPLTTENARVALLAFNGDAYQGLAARTRFDEQDYAEAGRTLRILSGLYGLLRPLDLIRPYRLEMGTRLVTERGRNLYQWWGGVITDMLRHDLAASPGAEVLVNLASAEYFGAVHADDLGARVVTPRFEDTSVRGRRSVISFFAKRARGELAAWLVLNRVRTADALTDFDAAGYRYDHQASSADRPVFVRTYAAR